MAFVGRITRDFPVRSQPGRATCAKRLGRRPNLHPEVTIACNPPHAHAQNETIKPSVTHLDGKCKRSQIGVHDERKESPEVRQLTADRHRELISVAEVFGATRGAAESSGIGEARQKNRVVQGSSLHGDSDRR
ncbi:hypothetical protein L596_005111 [Steinernema carpocapsae]|uniref:Uncharacterized protein n=1 Tax=Steinernema carpocapsae TaxID=34508 RepID=A0A4U8UY26_STECR|nr:hypothetical protein L596_005111 [Steinernema carpocapsae]